MIGVDAGTKSLRVIFNLCNTCTSQLDKISKKGLEWSLRLSSGGHISKRNAWCSFNCQLKPALSYSVLTMSADPTKVMKVQEEIFYRFLSCLGVNHNICKAVQKMPTRYSSLGMFDLNILNL